VETFEGSGINRSSTKAPAGRSGLSGATGDAGGLAGGCCAANGIAKTSASANPPTRIDSERTRRVVCMPISGFLMQLSSWRRGHHTISQPVNAGEDACCRRVEKIEVLIAVELKTFS